VLELSVRLERDGPCDVPQPKFEGFFLERVLPDPVDASRQREVFFAQMQDVTIADAYAGSATFELHAPELAPLGTPEPLGGQVHAVSWTKAFAERLASERLPPP
jgi:acetoacetate decarboxylase